MIKFEDFKKIEIRIGKVINSEKIEEADRLLKLTFDMGPETRQIMASIAEYYPDPKELIGKIMPVITNLEPRNFRGYKSEGMLMAADVEGKPVFLKPESDVPLGSIIH